MDTRRLVLFVIFSMSILMLWDAWQRQQAPVAVVQQVAVQNTSPAQVNPVATASIDSMAGDYKLQQAQRISVKTDLYQAEIETTGGDLRKLALLKHRAADNDKNNFVLLDDAAQPMTYVAQSGLLGTDLPTHHALFSSTANSYELQEGQDKLEVRLTWASNGVNVDKIYTFHRQKYAIDVNYEIHNNTAARPPRQVCRSVLP